MLELLFVDAQFQCGASAPLAKFEIIVEEQNREGTTFLHTLKIGERIVLERDNYVSTTINRLTDADCMSVLEVKEVTVNTIPDLPGLYNQPNIASYLDELQEAESIYLYEFGATTGPSADYNDLILRIDWDYQEEITHAD